MRIPITLSPKAKMPQKGTDGAAGYDLFATEGMVFAPHSIGGVKTGVKVAIPENFYGRIAPKSGLAIKHGIDIFGGVIDSDYRGELVVIVHNASDFIWQILPGEKVAQLIIEQCYPAQFVEFTNLPETERGQGGFGSTGV